MKFAATLIAAASAAANSAENVATNCATNAGNKVCWESYFTLAFNNDTQALEVDENSKTGSCGLQYITTDALVNSTCTVNWSSTPSEISFGNGAFVDSNGLVTGLDGISSTVSAIASWDTAFDEQWTIDNTVNGVLQVDNTTEFNQEDCFTTGLNKWIEVSCTDNGAPSTDVLLMFTNNVAGKQNDFAIANYGGEDNVIAVQLNVPCDVNSVSSPAGSITPGSDSDCSFSITVTNDKADLLYFSATTNEVVDFFSASVSA